MKAGWRQWHVLLLMAVLLAVAPVCASARQVVAGGISPAGKFDTFREDGSVELSAGAFTTAETARCLTPAFRLRKAAPKIHGLKLRAIRAVRHKRRNMLGVLACAQDAAKWTHLDPAATKPNPEEEWRRPRSRYG